MAAGLGFKTFAVGEILSAANVNGYLMQGVLVFANATARDAAITSPQEGQFAYLKDTNVTTYYTGSAWANLDTTGMTNPMTTTGDVIYSSSGSTPARLGLGTAGQVLQVNSGATAPEWAAPAGGGKVLQVVSTTYSTATTITTATFADSDLTLSITPTSATSKILVLATVATAVYRNATAAAGRIKLVRGATDIWNQSGGESFVLYVAGGGTTGNQLSSFNGINYLDSPATTSSTTYKIQGRVETALNSSAIIFQQNSAVSTMTLLEIGV